MKNQGLYDNAQKSFEIIEENGLDACATCIPLLIWEVESLENKLYDADVEIANLNEENSTLSDENEALRTEIALMGRECEGMVEMGNNGVKF